MARTKQANKQQQKKKKMRARGAPKVATHASNAYARLLANPCTGPLVHAPGSSEGGQVVRFESDFIIGSGATDTAGFFLITPGALNAAPTPVCGFGTLVSNAATDTTSVSPATGGVGTYFPGQSFLTTNASSYRCVASCVQVYWPGTELNRSGIVSAAQASYGLLSTAVATTVASLRTLCPVVERMPTDHMEVKWAPNYSDGLFRNPSSTSVPEDGHSSILVTWAGLPVATGVRLRVVSVYEWRPRVTGLVLSSNTETVAAGAHTIQEVRHSLDRADANWWNRTGQAAYQFLSGAVVAYHASRGRSFPQPRIEL